ncbi:hypothetical protein C8J56DRAFT_900954 [Mycena floridula]|nr:hypothetical protein C8J56DRAFT_900954 [Mycena floridula]
MVSILLKILLLYGFAGVASRVLDIDSFKKSDNLYILDAFIASQGDFPPQCANSCDNVIQTSNSCGTFSCLCSSIRETNITSCINCIVAVRPTEAIIQQAQDILNQFAAVCKANNVSIETQTVSGFTPTASTPVSNILTFTSSAETIASSVSSNSAFGASSSSGSAFSTFPGSALSASSDSTSTAAPSIPTSAAQRPILHFGLFYQDLYELRTDDDVPRFQEQPNTTLNVAFQNNIDLLGGIETTFLEFHNFRPIYEGSLDPDLFL